MYTRVKKEAVVVAATRPRRRRIKALIITFATIVVLASIALGVASFYFSNMILQVVHNLPVYTLSVTAVDRQTVTLPRTGETLMPGEYQLEWPGGAAIIGPVLTANATAVKRRLIQTTASLAPGTLVYMTRDVYTGELKKTLGLAILDVQVPDAPGSMPAWYVPGKLITWALLVHGRGADRNEPLRVFQPLAKLGLPLLAISYRNDIGALASPDGFNHLGDTEWLDLQAAAQYALAHGAQHLLLYGWSQGGAVVEAFVHHSALAHDVQALVLDAPILNWRDTLAYQARRRSVPGFIATTAEFVSSLRSGINFDALDQFEQPQPSTPMLLFQGANDTTTPASICDTFARDHPAFVTYVRVPNTEHTDAWNTDPQTYDREVTEFVTEKLKL